MFLYCLVCDKQYKNEECYNQHLKRRPHQKKFLKLKTLNDRQLIRDQTKWEQWYESNQPKIIKNKNDNK